MIDNYKDKSDIELIISDSEELKIMTISINKQFQSIIPPKQNYGTNIKPVTQESLFSSTPPMPKVDAHEMNKSQPGFSSTSGFMQQVRSPFDMFSTPFKVIQNPKSVPKTETSKEVLKAPEKLIKEEDKEINLPKQEEISNIAINKEHELFNKGNFEFKNEEKKATNTEMIKSKQEVKKEYGSTMKLRVKTKEVGTESLLEINQPQIDEEALKRIVDKTVSECVKEEFKSVIIPSIENSFKKIMTDIDSKTSGGIVKFSKELEYQSAEIDSICSIYEMNMKTIMKEHNKYTEMISNAIKPKSNYETPKPLNISAANPNQESIPIIPPSFMRNQTPTMESRTVTQSEVLRSSMIPEAKREYASNYNPMPNMFSPVVQSQTPMPYSYEDIAMDKLLRQNLNEIKLELDNGKITIDGLLNDLLSSLSHLALHGETFRSDVHIHISYLINN